MHTIANNFIFIGNKNFIDKRITMTTYQKNYNDREGNNLSGCKLVVRGLGWAVNLDILGSIPTKCSPELFSSIT